MRSILSALWLALFHVNVTAKIMTPWNPRLISEHFKITDTVIQFMLNRSIEIKNCFNGNAYDYRR